MRWTDLTAPVAAATAVFLALWLLQLMWRIMWARGPKPAPGQPVAEFIGLTPAVVHLITANSEMTHDAAAATVIDLAARGFVGIEEVGPTLSLVRLHRKEDALRPDEQQVLDHLRALADREGVVATQALAEGSRDLENWWKTFQDNVIAEARRLGLTRKVRGWGSGMSLTGMIAFGLVGLLVDMLVIPGDEPSGVLVAPVWFAGLFVMIAFDRKLRGERLTKRGRVAAGQWLTEKEHLKGIANLTRLPAAAVTIWGRPFAYASALGLSRSVASLPIVVDRRFDEGWSDQGGLWHKVRIRYPGQADRAGKVLVPLIFLSWAAATPGGSLWYASGDWRLNDMPPLLFSFMMLPGGGLVPVAMMIVIALPAGLVARILWWSGTSNPKPRIAVNGKVIRRVDLPMTGDRKGFVYLVIDDGRRTVDAVRTTADRVRHIKEGDQVQAWVSRAGFLAAVSASSR